MNFYLLNASKGEIVKSVSGISILVTNKIDLEGLLMSRLTVTECNVKARTTENWQFFFYDSRISKTVLVASKSPLA